MRLKCKYLLLLPLSLSLVNCSSSEEITFKCDNFTFSTFYNDRYFNMSNSEYHEEIALASHAMALATFNNDPDYSTRSNNLRELWQKEGFERIKMSDSFYVKPDTDSIGYGISSKTIQLLGGKYTLIAIAVRGGDYDAEWASNFTIGSSGNSKGFDEASDQVIKGISDYIVDYEIEGHVRFWISGYSRAAITSNLVAGKLLTNMSKGEYISKDVHYNERDFYAYCFEPPLGAIVDVEVARGDLYQGIHNLLNYNDLVPLVAPKEWGFTRFGTDHYYPDRLTDIYFDKSEREKLVSQYHFAYGAQDFAKYTVDEWKFFDVGGEYAEINNLPRESINPSLGRFCRTLIHELATTGFYDRATYSTLLQTGIRELIATIFDKNENIKGIDKKNIVNIVFEYTFIRNLIAELESNKAAEFALDAEMLFLQIFGANEDNIDIVRELYNDNIVLLTLFANGLKNRQDITAQLLYRDNAMGIIIGHMPELSYSFLRSCDTRINGSNACKLNDGIYDIVHITNPKDFTVFENNLNKEVFSYKNEVMSTSCLSVEKFHDGSINLYLPKNGEYKYIGEFGELTISPSEL